MSCKINDNKGPDIWSENKSIPRKIFSSVLFFFNTSNTFLLIVLSSPFIHFISFTSSLEKLLLLHWNETMHYEEVLLEPGHYDDQSETLAGRHLVIHSAKGAASVSLFASVCVVLSYFFILWYQSSMANRISLRLIVFACLVNSIYNVMQLTVTSILDTSSSCRPAIYVVIATDIMCCMCLAMIGVNLVMILIVRINHPAKMEKYYYACIIIVSLLGLLIPLASNTVGGSPSGRMCW